MKGMLAVVLCGSAALCQTGCSTRPQPEPADLILRGGFIVSSPGSQAAQALAVSGERISAIGSDDEILALRGPDTVDVRLNGAVVIAGFVDHHVHLLNLGQTLLNQERGQEMFLDLGAARSPEEVAALVRLRAASQPPGTWILGKGWSQGAWGAEELPDHRALSAAAPLHPVYLARVDGHAGWVNRAALDLAKIEAGEAQPPGGRIGRLPGGEPSGILLERANEPVLDLVPQPSDTEIRRAFRLAAEKLAEQGVVEAHDAGFLAFPGVVGLEQNFERILKLLVEEDAANPLPLRIRLMIPAPSALADSVTAHPERFRDLSPRLSITHLKLFADGALGSRGAALSAPFSDDASTSGVPRMGADDILRESERALDAGMDVAVHAIGDEAVRQTLDAFEEALRRRPQLPPGRLRIEHFSYARPEDFERAARLGVGISIQPDFVAPDDQGFTMEDSRLGAERIEGVYAWGRLAGLGAELAGGSDYFDKPGPALLTFHSAATRSNLNGKPAEGWRSGERLSRVQALELATKPLPPGGGPRASGPAMGGPADLTVLSANPLEAPAADLLEIQVLATLSGGRWTFHGGGLKGLPAPR